MIRTINLTRKFGDKTAVEDVSLEVAAGEVFGFLGPNGAGKTTTVRMLACLISSTGGEAYVEGLRVGRDDAAIRRIIGIATESPGLYDRLSAWKNLDFFGRLYGLDESARRRQVEKYLQMLGLWERRYEPVGAFSKGMKQKVAIARALLHEPRVLYLDEPTSGLDPEAAKTVRDFIAELKEEGRTVFLCTHNLDEADRLSTRIGIINRRLRVVDTPASLRRKLYGFKAVVRVRELTLAARRAAESPPFAGRTETGDRVVSLTLTDPGAEIPELVRRLVNAGADVLAVAEEQHSLEDVYLKIVHGGEPQ